MNKLIIRWLINGVALFAAVYLIPGLNTGEAQFISYVFIAVIFGLVNALVRPLLKFLTCPLIILTLGLFTLLINTFLFYLTFWLGQSFHLGFIVPNFWDALLGSLIVTAVSILLTFIFRDELDDKRRKKRN